MRAFLSMLALGVAGLVVAAPTLAGDDFASKGTVKATRKDGKVTIVVAGKGDWHVNGEYDIKVTLGAKTLRKADGKYVWTKGEENKKADSVTFTNVDDPANSGEVKAVFCDAQSCSNPLKTTFTVQ